MKEATASPKDAALRLALEAMNLANSSHDKMLLSDPPQSAWRYHNVDMKLREAINAIKSSLEANEFNPDWDTQAVLTEEIQRMAKRIEELEAKDEAVAWMWMPTGEVTTDPDRADGMWEPLFLATQQRKPLTDEEIHQIFIANSVVVDNGNAYMVAGLRALNITRAIEAAHGIKGEA